VFGKWKKRRGREVWIAAGDFKYKDQNGDGVMTDADRIFQGYTTPRFGGLSAMSLFSSTTSLSLPMLYSNWGNMFV